MRRKRFLVLTLVLACCIAAIAGTPQFEINVDSQFPDRQWELKYTYVRASPLIRVNLLTNGVGWTASSDWSGYLWFGTNTHWEGTNWSRITGTFYTNKTYADFQATTNTFTNGGVYYAGIVMTNATNWIEWGLGKIWVRSSGGINP